MTRTGAVGHWLCAWTAPVTGAAARNHKARFDIRSPPLRVLARTGTGATGILEGGASAHKTAGPQGISHRRIAAPRRATRFDRVEDPTLTGRTRVTHHVPRTPPASGAPTRNRSGPRAWHR